MPFTVEDTVGLRGKEVKETTREIETTVRTSRTLVHDGGGGSLSLVRHTDRLEAVGAGVSATELLTGRSDYSIRVGSKGDTHGGIQSDNEIARDVVFTTSASVMIQ